MAWRSETKPFGGHTADFDGNHTEDEFLSTLVGFEGGKWMATLEETAERLKALANVVDVKTGPDHLSIIALDPAPFPSISNLTKDVSVVEVIVATPVRDDELDRWREAGSHYARDLHDRDGDPDPMNGGRAKGLAADMGITTPPVMNAIHGDRLGYLFATIEDAQRFNGGR